MALASFPVPAEEWTEIVYDAQKESSATATRGPLSIWIDPSTLLPGDNFSFYIDDVKISRQVVSSTSGVKIGRHANGVAYVESSDATHIAQLQGGGLIVQSKGNSGEVAVYDVEGIRKTGAGTPVVLGHESVEANSPVQIYASGDNKIEMLSPVTFQGDTGWLNVSPEAGWSSTVQVKVKAGIVSIKGNLTNASFSNASFQIAALLPSGIPGPPATFLGSYQGVGGPLRNTQLTRSGEISIRTSASSGQGIPVDFTYPI
ncbi:hypothetical protein [Leucobacter sp. NPDC077196]|uniref:hypothetical protein n=1 Tax=Leucobacter sp. NPDC077196 TaxID=3154959 RepID=UPI003443BE0A